MPNETSLVRPRKRPTISLNSTTAEEFISIPLSDLLPDPNQARINFVNLEELKNSIKQHGQLEPITVIRNADGKYIIKNGERRYRAIKMLAEETGEDISNVTIKAIYKHGDVDENIGLIVNMIREDYSPFEIAFALKNLKDANPKLTLEQIGRYIGKSRQNVGEYLNLLRLPEKIKDHAIENNIVPFYILKQLAANPRLSEKEKIVEYDRLIALHSNLPSPNYEALEAVNVMNVENKQVLPPTNKKFNIINRKIDTTIKAFEKFKIENIETKEDRQTLSAKLEKIIDNANKLKEILDADE